jgi:hypothetical protein
MAEVFIVHEIPTDKVMGVFSTLALAKEFIGHRMGVANRVEEEFVVYKMSVDVYYTGKTVDETMVS